MKTKSDKDKLTIKDAARRLRVCVSTVYNAIDKGKLKPVRHGINGMAFWVTRASVEELEKTIGGNDHE